MSLKEILAEDLKSAMKDKDTVRKNTVQMVRAAVLQFEKDKKVTLDDEGVLEVIPSHTDKNAIIKLEKDINAQILKDAVVAQGYKVID